MACSSTCPAPGTHGSMGECIRSKGIKVAYANSANNQDATAQKRWDANLESYRAARAEGLQPNTTNQRDIDNAKRVADAAGHAVNL